MGLFGSSSPFDADIEKATNENNTTDQWGLILEICDRVAGSSANAKECLRSVMRRLAHTDPHVVIQAITLLDACVSNCGKTFHLEVASREFENEFRRLMTKQQAAVAQKMAGLIKKWAEGEFKSDPQLNLIPTLYNKLRAEGVQFSEPDSSSSKGAAAKAAQPLSQDPNVVSSQQEMDDIAKAIELSLKESPMKHATSSSNRSTVTSSSSSSAATATSLYPSTSLSSAATSSYTASTASAVEARKVRALYDFEAAEDNELSFMAGDIIHVTDDSDPNWWKGYVQRGGEGLFPASFVTADLSVEPESLLRLDLESSKGTRKSVQFADDVKEQEEEQQTVEINEEKVDRLLYLLHEANPEDPSTDSGEMLSLEKVVHQMGPLVDTELERVDRTHAQLAKVSVGLVDAFNLYHALMRESEKSMQFMGYGQQPQQAMGYGGGPPSMMMGPGMFPAPHHHIQQQQQQPGGYMPGMPTPNGQFPIPPTTSNGGPPSSQLGAPQHPHHHHPQAQPQMTQIPGQMHPNMSQQQQQPQMQHHHQLQQHHPQSQMMNGQMNAAPQMNSNPNTVSSSSGAPITNTGMPSVNFPQQPVSNSFPHGAPPQMSQQQPPPSFNQVVGTGMQFQQHPAGGVPNGASPQHVAGGPQQGNSNPQMLHQMPPTSGMMGGGQMVNSQQMNHFSPMGVPMGGQPPAGAPQMMHPGPHAMMEQGNIPIYQQR